MSNEYIYVDGIDGVALVDGVLRFDLVAITQVKDNKANLQKVGGMAMSLQGFLRTYGQMSQVVDKMVEQGLLKKNEQPKAPEVDAVKLS